MYELATENLEKFFEKTGLKNSFDVNSVPSKIKTIYTPSQINDIFEHISALLKSNKLVYVRFDYKPDGVKSSEIKFFKSYVTKNNVKYLPFFVKNAWSDINVYDIFN